MQLVSVHVLHTAYLLLIITDEVALQPHLSMSIGSRCIEGLVDFGSGKSKDIVDHALVFFVAWVK